jgi:hypothetical protein
VVALIAVLDDIIGTLAIGVLPLGLAVVLAMKDERPHL